MMIPYKSQRISAHYGLKSKSLEFPKNERIFSKQQLVRYYHTDEVAFFLKFLEENKIFQWMAYFNARSVNPDYYIHLTSSRRDNDSIDWNRKSEKAEIMILFKGNYRPWSEILRQCRLIDQKDLNEQLNCPPDALLIDKETLQIFNGGYTTKGLCLDRVRSTPLLQTEEDIYAHLLNLNETDPIQLQNYLNDLIVFDFEEEEIANPTWKMEVLISTDKAQELSGSHSSLRLNSPWGHIFHFGYWRKDDLSSRCNQRGILHSPDPIELRMQELSFDSSINPHTLFKGTLEENIALRILAQCLYLHRNPATRFYSLSSSHESPIEKGGATGMNCCDFVLDKLQFALPGLNRKSCTVTFDDFLTLYLLPKTVNKSALIAKICENVLGAMIDQMGGLLRPCVINSMKLNDVTAEFEIVQGQPLIKTANDFGKNIAMSSPDKLAQVLRQIYFELKEKANPLPWRLSEIIAFNAKC